MAEWGRPDFHLVDAETAIIAEKLDIPFTTEEMKRSIPTHHTEHPDFAKKIPTSFIRLVEYDRAQSAAPSPLSRRSLGEGGAAAYYIALFQHFGYALIAADGIRALSEIAAYSDYLNALRTYQESTTENAPRLNLRALSSAPSSLSRRSLCEGGADTCPILLPSITFAPQTAYTRLCDILLSRLDTYRSQAGEQ